MRTPIASFQTLSDEFTQLTRDVDHRLAGQDKRIDQMGAMSSAMMGMAINAANSHTPRGRVAMGAGWQNGEGALSVGYAKSIGRASFSVGGAFSDDDQIGQRGLRPRPLTCAAARREPRPSPRRHASPPWRVAAISPFWGIHHENYPLLVDCRPAGHRSDRHCTGRSVRWQCQRRVQAQRQWRAQQGGMVQYQPDRRPVQSSFDRFIVKYRDGSAHGGVPARCSKASLPPPAVPAWCMRARRPEK